jgi:hypothetical protein
MQIIIEILDEISDCSQSQSKPLNANEPKKFFLFIYNN